MHPASKECLNSGNRDHITGHFLYSIYQVICILGIDFYTKYTSHLVYFKILKLTFSIREKLDADATATSFGTGKAKATATASSRQARKTKTIERSIVPAAFHVIDSRQFYHQIATDADEEYEDLLFFFLHDELNHLKSGLPIFVDGTFAVTGGSSYCQLLVVSVAYFNSDKTAAMALPVLFCFMKDKAKVR